MNLEHRNRIGLDTGVVLELLGSLPGCGHPSYKPTLLVRDLDCSLDHRGFAHAGEPLHRDDPVSARQRMLDRASLAGGVVEGGIVPLRTRGGDGLFDSGPD